MRAGLRLGLADMEGDRALIFERDAPAASEADGGRGVDALGSVVVLAIW
jgi:hypothetical protein